MQCWPEYTALMECNIILLTQHLAIREQRAPMYMLEYYQWLKTFFLQLTKPETETGMRRRVKEVFLADI